MTALVFACWLMAGTVLGVVTPLLERRGLPRAATPASVAAQSDTTIRTPAAGSATRTAILDAVRARLNVKVKFKVGHIRATDRWAFVRCVEVVDDEGSLQETDLDVAALLERRSTGGGPAQWRVVELWALSTDDEKPYTPFARRIRERAKADRLPVGIFPRDFLSSDVPVE